MNKKQKSQVFGVLEMLAREHNCVIVIEADEITIHYGSDPYHAHIPWDENTFDEIVEFFELKQKSVI